MTESQTLPPIDSPEMTWDNSVSSGDECFFCGERPKPGKRFVDGINYSPQDGMIYDPNAPEELVVQKELGWYPVGPACIKKIPTAYRC